MKSKLGFSNRKTNLPGAIILGGNFVGLQIVRSLGAHGVPVWVIDSDRTKSIAQFSKYTERFIESKAAVTDLLIQLALEHRLNGWVVFAGSDEYVEALSDNHDILSSVYTLTTPRPEVTRFALDKRLTYAKAEQLGIAAPWTITGRSLASIGRQTIPYPIILKPAINHHFFPQTNIKALAVDGPADLERRFAQMNEYIPAEEILVQERIPGDGENQFSFCGVCKEGQVYASLVARRRRQFPLDFGNASTFVETTEQLEVEASGHRFVESIGCDGMVEVEFKYDPRDGKYKILDVNPRPWGWNGLGKAAGMDFSYLLWQQKVGIETAPVERKRRATWIREITDFVAIAKSRNRFTELGRSLRAMLNGRIALATFSLTDPLPFFMEFALWLRAGSSRQRKAREFLQSEVCRTEA